MRHPLFALAAVGAAGFALWKVASLLLLPLVGTLLGIVFTVLKFVVLAGLIWFAFWLVTRKKDKGGEATAES
jgi:threonine/homoserine/homoserine lactone efflux protein